MRWNIIHSKRGTINCVSHQWLTLLGKWIYLFSRATFKSKPIIKSSRPSPSQLQFSKWCMTLHLNILLSNGGLKVRKTISLQELFRSFPSYHKSVISTSGNDTVGVWVFHLSRCFKDLSNVQSSSLVLEIVGEKTISPWKGWCSSSEDVVCLS